MSIIFGSVDGKLAQLLVGEKDQHPIIFRFFLTLRPEIKPPTFFKLLFSPQISLHPPPTPFYSTFRPQINSLLYPLSQPFQTSTALQYIVRESIPRLLLWPFVVCYFCHMIRNRKWGYISPTLLYQQHAGWESDTNTRCWSKCSCLWHQDMGCVMIIRSNKPQTLWREWGEVILNTVPSSVLKHS